MIGGKKYKNFLSTNLFQYLKSRQRLLKSVKISVHRSQHASNQVEIQLVFIKAVSFDVSFL